VESLHSALLLDYTMSQERRASCKFQANIQLCIDVPISHFSLSIYLAGLAPDFIVPFNVLIALVFCLCKNGQSMCYLSTFASIE
jgi:hypothetical protein